MSTREVVVRQESPLPALIATLIDDRLPEAIVRTALAAVFQGAPAAQVALGLAICKQAGLNPLAKHVAVFQPQQDAAWAVMVTVEGRIEIATRHPDFAGVEFTDPQDVGDEVHIRATVYRKSWKKPVGPILGRCKRAGYKRGGGTYPIAWAEEIARSRALRNALRIAFGLQIPDVDQHFEEIEDAQEIAVEISPMRLDQRKELFWLAHELGWDDDERHKRAGVSSFTELGEEQAAQLISEWQGLLERQEIPIKEPEAKQREESADPAVKAPRAEKAPEDEVSPSEFWSNLAKKSGITLARLLKRAREINQQVTSLQDLEPQCWTGETLISWADEVRQQQHLFQDGLDEGKVP